MPNGTKILAYVTLELYSLFVIVSHTICLPNIINYPTLLSLSKDTSHSLIHSYRYTKFRMGVSP